MTEYPVVPYYKLRLVMYPKGSRVKNLPKHAGCGYGQNGKAQAESWLKRMEGTNVKLGVTTSGWCRIDTGATVQDIWAVIAEPEPVFNEYGEIAP